jgi:hypothetical protein
MPATHDIRCLTLVFLPSAQNLHLSRELKYGIIGGFITLAWMALGYALAWDGTAMATYAPYFSLLILALTIYVTVLFKRDRDKGGVISFKEALFAGMSVSFVIGLLVGALLMVYVQYINPGYVNTVVQQATDYYKSEKIPQEQIDKGIASVRAMYSPFGQFTYGIGTTMLTGLLISLVVAFIMKRSTKFNRS